MGADVDEGVDAALEEWDVQVEAEVTDDGARVSAWSHRERGRTRPPTLGGRMPRPVVSVVSMQVSPRSSLVRYCIYSLRTPLMQPLDKAIDGHGRLAELPGDLGSFTPCR